MDNASDSSPINPHFFQPLLPGFLNYLNIPIAFYSKHIKGTSTESCTTVKLRSKASDVTWEVKMDGRRLTHGWQNFAESHDLRVGDIVVLRHEGDSLFNVTCFGPSCCEIQYDDNNKADDDVIQIYSDSDSDSDKYQHTREARESLSDNSCFVTRVTVSNLRKDSMCLPMKFCRSNGLVNRKCEISLMNEDGKQWRLFLNYHKTSGYVYIQSNWRSFGKANRIRVNDLLNFKLVQTGTKPVIQLCSSVNNQNCLQASSSSSSKSQDRFLTLTLTPYSLQHYKLCLPATFVKANGIENAKNITLVDRYGVKRTTSLKPDDKYGRMRLGKEWREFCEANGVKIGESFKVELIKGKEEKTTHLLKFCSKVL